MEETDEAAQLVERVAALDIGKVALMACVRVPHEDKPGRRRQEVREYATTTRSLLELADWLRCQGVTLVVMEATSSYWKPPFYLLEAEGFECWLLNARHVKNVPGRPKTDKLDSVWLAKVAERGMCTPSLVHPRPVRQLRDLTRYRRTLIRERTREKQRLEKILEDAQIKLSAVISDIFGVSGRAMIGAMIGGQRNPRALAQLARGTMRNKTRILEEALTGRADRHGFICQMMLDRIDGLSAQITQLDARVEQAIAPFARQVSQLDEVAGIGTTSAQELIAEIGTDMGRFPTAAHLVSWAKFAPIDNSSAGQKKGGSTGRATPGSAGPSARSSSAPPAPTPSLPSVTGASPAAAARNAPSSPPGTPSSPSSTTCSPILPPAIPTSGPPSTTARSAASVTPATSSASSSTSPARKSPSAKPPDPARPQQTHPAKDNPAPLTLRRVLTPARLSTDFRVRHCRVSFPRARTFHPERPATGLSWEGGPALIGSEECGRFGQMSASWARAI